MKALDPGFGKFLSGYPVEVQAITLALREIIHSHMGVAEELIYPESLGFSPDGSYAKKRCYLWPCKSHVTLGFYFGSQLEDPDNLLEGVGKRMRHVKVRTMEEAQSAAVDRLVQQAWLTSSRN